MLNKHSVKYQFTHDYTRKVEFVIEADELDGNHVMEPASRFLDPARRHRDACRPVAV